MGAVNRLTEIFSVTPLYVNHGEWKRLKGVYKARSKVDLELFYGKLADEAESGFKKNNLRPAYRASSW